MRKLMIWLLVALMALSGFAFAESTDAAGVAINGEDAVRTETELYFAIPDGTRQMLVRVPLDGGDPICVDRGDRFDDMMPYQGGVVYLKTENDSAAITACKGSSVSTVYAFGKSTASSLNYYSGRMLVLIDGLLHSIDPGTQVCLRLSGTMMLDYVIGGGNAYFLSGGDRMEYTATLEGGETISTQAGCVYSMDLNSGETTLLLKSGARDLKIANDNLYFHYLSDAYAVRAGDSAQLMGKLYSMDVQLHTLDSQCTEPDSGFWPLSGGLVTWYGGALSTETEAGTLQLYTPEKGATVVSDGERVYVWESGKQALTQVEMTAAQQVIYAGDLTQARDLSLIIPDATPDPDATSDPDATAEPDANENSDLDPEANAKWFNEFAEDDNSSASSGQKPKATPIGTTPTPAPTAVPLDDDFSGGANNAGGTSGSGSSGTSGGSGGSTSSGGTYSVSISYLKVTGGSVNVRSGPGTGYSVKTALSKGTIVQCTGKAAKDTRGNTWYQIKRNGSTGWVSAGYVTKSSAPGSSYTGPEQSMSGKSVVITGESVNVRAKPNLNGSNMGVVTKGTTLTFKGVKSVDSRGVAWYKVSYNGKTGWVSSRYSKVSKSSGGSGGSGGSSSSSGTKVVSTGDVTIRSKANKTSKILGYMASGKTAKYLGSKKKDSRGVVWYKISYNGVTGWVSSKYTKLK